VIGLAVGEAGELRAERVPEQVAPGLDERREHLAITSRSNRSGNIDM
jgi:hypothetical protein